MTRARCHQQEAAARRREWSLETRLGTGRALHVPEKIALGTSWTLELIKQAILIRSIRQILTPLQY